MTDLDLAPAGLATKGEQRTLGEDLDPTTLVVYLVTAEIKASNLGVTQAAGAPTSSMARSRRPCSDPRSSLSNVTIRQERFLLPRRRRVVVADVGRHGC